MNLHQRHLEDLILYEGKAGLDKIKKILSSPEHVSTKIDGSPSFFIGRNEAGDLFVSTKSIANKTPKVYRSLLEMDGLTPKLQEKLNNLLKFFKNTEIEGILQGDYLFEQTSLFNLNGHICWHPNTLVYGITLDQYDPAWKVGVAIHTQYDSNMTIMKPFQGYLDSPEIFQQNLSVCLPTILDADFGDHPDYDITHVAQKVERYFNRLIRNGEDKIIHHEHTNQISEELSLHKKDDLHQILTLVHDVSVAKLGLINRLNSSTNVKTWVLHTTGELEEVDHEGYVIGYGGAVYKLVNRGYFSRYNFSPTILKGWNEPTRK